MVIELEASPRPLVQFALCRDSAQLPQWDAKLDYGNSSTAAKLLASRLPRRVRTSVGKSGLSNPTDCCGRYCYRGTSSVQEGGCDES